LRTKKSSPYLELRNVTHPRQTKRILKKTGKRANLVKVVNLKLQFEIRKSI
jgi:hypothetical protein